MIRQISLNLLALIAASAPLTDLWAADPNSNYDAAVKCSQQLKSGPALKPDDQKRCILAIATTYIDAEENSLPPEKQLVADDVSRHRLGAPPEFAPGNGAKLIADMSHGVISGIKNRQWTVEGNQAWIAYDGYLAADPSKPGFYVAERITVENGLIKEILVAGVNRK